jgi:hypothetical protein
MPPPSSGADADESMECVCECSLVTESRQICDVNERQVWLAHKLPGVVNAMFKQPLVSGDAEGDLE